jgi:ubiquitin
MIYKQDYYGYVYEWTNITNGKKYIGSHYGSIEDYYTGSGKDFMVAYKKSPKDFVIKILEYVTLNDKKLVLLTEKKWLDSVPNIKDNPLYYNLNNDAVGGFGYIDNSHIAKRANTLKEKHTKYGLSRAEKKSYKQKIQTRLDRIASTGFTDKEKEQHANYGYQVSVTTPTGETKIYSSCGQATKDLGIDIQYGLKVCSKKIDFKRYKIVKLQDPLVDCR